MVDQSSGRDPDLAAVGGDILASDREARTGATPISLCLGKLDGQLAQEVGREHFVQDTTKTNEGLTSLH